MGTTPDETAVKPPCVICYDTGWVCEFHPDTAWVDGEMCCGGAGKLCVCQEVTADEVNALSERMRDYIHDLNIGYDPRGDVRRQVIELHISRENAAALAHENERMRRVIGRLLRSHIRRE